MKTWPTGYTGRKKEIMETNKNMWEIPQDYEMVKFNGFTAYPGYWVGYNLAGEPVATSGWTCQDNIMLYTKHQGVWQKNWVDIENPVIPQELRDKVLKEIEYQAEWEYYQSH